jgi:alpha-beta hydrolase superfamily lysophospholipase
VILKRLAPGPGLLLASLFAGLLAACAPTLQRAARPEPGFTGPRLENDAFVSFDGTRLGLSRWDAQDPGDHRPVARAPRGADDAGQRPGGHGAVDDGALGPAPPWAVIVGVHGMNDYANAFHLAAPWWASQGVTTLAYDQRGFGRSPERGIWASDAVRVQDLRTIVALARRRWPGAIIAVAGESLGGAVAIEAFASDAPPAADRLVLMSPAVWGWSTQPLLYRSLLWLAARTAPAKVFTPPGFVTDRIYASDNYPELVAMGRDPLMIWGARTDALYGLVTTMQRAQDDVGRLRAPTLYLYGAHDEIIPRAAAFKAVRKLPSGARTAFYRDGWHLLMRDRQGPVVWRDVLAFIRDPATPLPSGAPAIPGAPAPRTASPAGSPSPAPAPMIASHQGPRP